MELYIGDEKYLLPLCTYVAGFGKFSHILCMYICLQVCICMYVPIYLSTQGLKRGLVVSKRLIEVHIWLIVNIIRAS